LTEIDVRPVPIAPKMHPVFAGLNLMAGRTGKSDALAMVLGARRPLPGQNWTQMPQTARIYVRLTAMDWTLAMTITLKIPADLEGSILACAALNGNKVEDAILTLLRSSVGSSPLIQKMITMSSKRLEPAIYSDEPLGTDTDFDYRPVPFKSVGTAIARPTTVGRLSPTSYPDVE
jgi:hypothetical protein